VYQVRLLRTEDAGHGGPFFYHFVVVLIGCFPASIFIYRSFGRLTGEDTGHRIFRHWMIVLFAVVLILFSIVKTKIIPRWRAW
jgi:4-amino-4-deoxy-L-arabinose transferase-like glycosyltransferase